VAIVTMMMLVLIGVPIGSVMVLVVIGMGFVGRIRRCRQWCAKHCGNNTGGRKGTV
jgi:hypothetical protein